MPRRRTNQERSDETQRKLLDATVECLMEYGYSGTTTTLVSQKAGVSRGAQLHHFAKKSDLVKAAIDHVFRRRVDEFRASMAELPEGENRLSAALDLLWKAYSEGNTFFPCIEFMIASRTDPELEAQVKLIARGIDKEIKEVFQELFGDANTAHPFVALAPRFGLAVMDGLSFARLGGIEESEVEAIIDLLKRIADLVEFSAGVSGPYKK